MKTTVDAATLSNPLTRFASIATVKHIRTLTQRVVAVKAHDMSATRARPVDIEQRRPTSVTHFTYALNRAFPGDVFCTQNHIMPVLHQLH